MKDWTKICATRLFIISLMCAKGWTWPIDDEYFDCENANEIIDQLQLCDGKADCTNAADEQNCRIIDCPAFTFRCRYGACIPLNGLCNGNADCMDGSDESSFICGHCLDESQIKCKNGECINKHELCNGRRDCSDGSDESKHLCNSEMCTEDQFRCNYGACIDMQRRCNSYVDCDDASDEIGCTRTQTRGPKTRIHIYGENEMEACEIPLNHTNMQAESRNQNTQLQPGSKVAANTRVRFWCAPNSVMHGDYSEVLCTRHGWQPPIPHCNVLCDESTLRQSVSTVVSCENARGEAFDCTNIQPGTIARFQCAVSYRLPHAEWAMLMTRTCQPNGEWDGETVKCEPVCGKAYTIASTITGELPWHVGIYTSNDVQNKNEFRRVCGGTIITTNLVLTAAHCFEKIDSELHDKEFFRVFAGQIERNITSIVTQGYDEYRHDIAVLRLSAPFVYNSKISPICLNWRLQTFDEQATPPIDTLTAYIISWNVVASDSNVKRYRRIEVTATSHSHCKDTATITALTAGGYQLHEDKFCVEPTKRYQTEAATQICPGDSGAGVFMLIGNKYDLIGVVSHAPSRQLDCTTGLVTVTAVHDMPHTLKKLLMDERE